MNLLLLFPEERTAAMRYALTGNRAATLTEALGAERGQILHIGLLDGPRGKARVIARTAASVVLEAFSLETQAPPPSKARLLLAMPRPKVLKRLLPQLAALDLEEVVLLRTWRVERASLEADLLQPAMYRPLLIEGLQQACLTRPPRLRVEPRFLPYVEDRLAEEAAHALAVVAHPRAERTLARLQIPSSTAPRVLMVGPERGLLDEEVRAFERAGFVAARMSRSILRVETACIAALAQLELLAEQRRLTESPEA